MSSFSGRLRSLLLAVSVAAHAVPTASAQTTASDMHGVYTGTYVCSQRQMSLTLELESAAGRNGLAGTFTFSSPGGNPDAPLGAFRLAGTFDLPTRAIRMQPREWVKRAPLYQAVGLSGTWDPSTGTISGTISGPGCSKFQVTRDASATARLEKLAADRAARYDDAPTALAEARSPEEQCLVLGKWLSRFKREYPDLDVGRTVVDQFYVRAVNLFHDEHFTPVFGKRFDELPEQDRLQARHAIQRCSQSAEARDDRTMFGVVLRPFLPGIASFGAADVASMVAYRRTLRQQREKVMKELEVLSGAGAFNRATAIRDGELAEFEVLWPSEHRAVKEAVDAALAESAAPGLDAWVESVVQNATAAEGLARIDAALARLARGPGTAAAPTPRRPGPPRPAPPAASGPDAVIASASPEARERAEARLRKRASELVAEVAQKERAALESLGSGLPALQAGAAWHRRVAQVFQGRQNEPSVRSAQAAFEARRQQDLAASASQVLDRVNQVKTAQEVSSVLNTYLGVPGDRSNPAAEKVFAVADARRRALAAAEERQAEAARSVAGYCASVPADDTNGTGEPSSREMCLAIANLMDGVNDRYREIQRSCEQGGYRENPMLAVQCLGLCGATAGKCELSVRLVRFEKIECADARPTGQPGFNCDYVLRYTASSPNVQQALSTIAPAGSIVQSRFVKQGSAWIRMSK